MRHLLILLLIVPAVLQIRALRAAETGGVPLPPAKHYATLPVAVSSFGAVAVDGWLYVYGGHIASTHVYSTAAVSHRFDRFHLTDGKTWESLPGGPGLQGLNLATYQGKIYRVGGMEPRNAPGAATDNRSVTDCVCYDPRTRAWQPMPPLPEGRSSHEVAVIGSTLLVVGGWSMHGEQGIDWLDTTLSLNLAAKHPAWRKIKQPFKRRALVAAVHADRLYVLGGFDEDDQSRRNVDIYDPKADRWATGPEIPGPDQNGFAPAACEHRGKLYISVADGTLYRLNDTAGAWEKVAHSTPRIVHRMVSDGKRILIIGGASEGKNLDLIESVDVD